MNNPQLETQQLLKIQEDTNKQLQQANATLQVSEEKLAVTLHSIGDAVLATDAEARVTLLNPIAEKLTGWTQAEATGRPVDEVFRIINEESRQPSIIPVKETLAHGTIQGLANHTILISRAGKEYAIADSCAPIRNRDGQVVGAVLVFRDVTEQRDMEIRLEKTRKELEINKKNAEEASEFSESVINTVREPLISLDQDLRVVTVSRSFYEVFKVKPEETVGHLIYDLGNKQWDIPKLRELLETILPQKTTFENYEVEHDFATIGRRIMLLNARQIQRVRGKERIILLAIEDITERKQIANELQKTRNELERIVQAQKVVITDTKESLNLETEGRLFEKSEISHRQEALEVVYAMETAFDFNIESLYDQIVLSISTTLRTPLVAIYEYRDGKIIRGAQCLDSCVSREVPHSKPCAACQSVLGNKKPQQFSGELGTQFTGNLCFDASRFHSYAGVPINGSQGEVFGMINVLDDKERELTDSEIKFIETFARYIAHELSRRDLEFRLRRGDEMRLLGQLTSGVAHEVRNPLNGILAIMGALSKELSDNERFEPYMQHMRNQITRLTELMEALLALGRPLREENIHEISMITLVENALSTWLQTLPSPKPSVRFVKPEASDKCNVKADSTFMTQMIINLLENACNHSQAGAEIVCKVYGQAVNRVIFSVTDAGSGIAEELLPRIFDPFFTTRKGGTGLGLSIVRNIVTNHQGRITAYNNASGPGATFEVVLPLCV
ncbi:MAG: PAS domain-containing protein [Fibrobacterota bacterium]